MSAKELVVVRHAAPQQAGLCAGRYPLPVEPATASIAALLPRLQPDRHPDFVASSPLPRCHDVAVLLAHHLGVPCRRDGRLAELHFGAWEGLSWDHLFKNRASELLPWMEAPFQQRPPGGESGRELEDRVRDFVRYLPSGRTLVITHAGVIRALRVLLLGWSWDRAFEAQVPYLEPILFDPTRPVSL